MKLKGNPGIPGGAGVAGEPGIGGSRVSLPTVHGVLVIIRSTLLNNTGLSKPRHLATCVHTSLMG